MKAGKFPLAYPTAAFAALLFVLGAMWYAASSQNSAAIYLLLFALASVFLVSIPHTVINLTGIYLRVESAKPTFVGADVCLPIEIINTSRATRYGIAVILPDARKTRKRLDCISRESAARLTVRFSAHHRGEHKIDAFDLTTSYPLGFVRAWKRCVCRQTYLVYPKPAGNPRLPINRSGATNSCIQGEPDQGDDFAGVRSYVRGESQRHIDWKAVARGQPLMTKQFATETRGVVDLDFSALDFSNVEEKLSQLALWVIEAERARLPYGLRLPSIEISPAVGQSHYHRCMRALSLFNPAGHEQP